MVKPSCVGLGRLEVVVTGVEVDLVVVGTDVGFWVVVMVRGFPLLVSTQYEWPILIPLQSSLTEGFYLL